MTSIIRATNKDVVLLCKVATQTFIESHGHSAAEADIDNYIKEKYSIAAISEELNNTTNIYYLIFHNDIAAGYSKIVFNQPYPESEKQNITKLDRIYLLSGFYDLSLGKVLLQFNIDLAKQNQQAGIWLFVWTENQRAVNFYSKNGFVIIESHDFKISATHSNPNHQMLLSLPIN